MKRRNISVLVSCLGFCSQASGQGGIITTVAGSNTPIIRQSGCSVNSGPATSATFAFDGDPVGLAVDASGNLYIASQCGSIQNSGIITTLSVPAGPNGVAVDASGNIYTSDGVLIQKVSASGIITTVAGNGTLGFSGDGGPATSASLDFAESVAVDASGNLFIADLANNRIRKVSASGIITTVAGSGPAGLFNNYAGGYSGDGGPATSALLSEPEGVAVDASGNLFIADTANHVIRKVSAGGIITTVAVSPLQLPCAVAVDASGNLFIADRDGARVMKVSTSGVTTTVAGGGTAVPVDGGPATSAELGEVLGVTVDAAGNVFFAELRFVQVMFVGTLTISDVRKVSPSGPAPAPSSTPSITSGGIVPVDSKVATIQAGEWVSIFGSNLASSTVTWNGNFLTTLGGTSVTINGKAAYLSFVSPTQINLQAPNDTAIGSVPVVVTTIGGTVTSTVTLAQFAPSFLLLDSKHVAGLILRSNGSGAYGGGTYDLLGPTGNSLGYATVAAMAGDTIELFAVGLGPTNQVVSAGQPFSGSTPTTYPVSLFINNANVIPTFAGLSSAGLYQINLTIPAGFGTGDVSLVAAAAGVFTQS